MRSSCNIPPLGLILTKDLMKNSRSLWSVLHALWILGAGVIVVAGCATAPEPPAGQASTPGGLVSVGRQAGGLLLPMTLLERHEVMFSHPTVNSDSILPS